MAALPFELHPEIPVEGLSLRDRWGPRYDAAMQMYARIEAECEAAGLPFRRPEHVPNTRRALETAEFVRRNYPEAFANLDRSLYNAHFVEGRWLGDPMVLDELVEASGTDASAVRVAVDAGVARPAVVESMTKATEIGITGTPAWLIDNRFLIPGAQPRDVIERVIARLRSESSSPPASS